MPAAFTDEEKTLIRSRLIDAGESRFARAGLRKTAIDELAADAGIAKGSFYAFFPSKEELFLVVLERIEEKQRRPLLAALSEGADLATILRAFSEMAEGLPSFARGGEDVSYLARKIPARRLAEHLERDRRALVGFFESLIAEGRIHEPGSGLGGSSGSGGMAIALAGVVQTLVFAAMHRMEYMEGAYEAWKGITIAALARYLDTDAGGRR